MGKGFGIAALICAIIAIPVPIYGFFISAVALVLATIAAFGNDKIFAAATPLIVGVNTFFMSPLLWVFMAKNNEQGSLTAMILAAVLAPFAVMVVRSMMTGQGPPKNPAPPPDYRSQSASKASSETVKSWREEEWWHPIEEPVANPVATPVTKPVATPAPVKPREPFANVAKEATARFNKGIEYRPKIPSVRLQAVPPQYLLFAILLVAIVVLVPEVRELGASIAIGFVTAMGIVLGRYGAFLFETILLVGLAALFFRYGKRLWLVGVVACLVMVGYSAQKDFGWLNPLKPRSSEGEQPSVVAAKEVARQPVVDTQPAPYGSTIQANDTQQTYHLQAGKIYLIEHDHAHRVHVHVVDGSIRLIYTGVHRPVACNEDDQDFGPNQERIAYLFPCNRDASVTISAGLPE